MLSCFLALSRQSRDALSPLSCTTITFLLVGVGENAFPLGIVAGSACSGGLHNFSLEIKTVGSYDVALVLTKQHDVCVILGVIYDLL